MLIAGSKRLQACTHVSKFQAGVAYKKNYVGD